MTGISFYCFLWRLISVRRVRASNGRQNRFLYRSHRNEQSRKNIVFMRLCGVSGILFSRRGEQIILLFFIPYAYYNLRITNPCAASSHKSSSCKSVQYFLCMPKVASGGIYSYWLSKIKRPLPSVLILVTICRHWSMA